MKYLSISIFIIYLSASFNVSAEPMVLADFAKLAEFESIKLSPDGKHYAATVPVEDKTILVILDKKTLKHTYIYQLQENEHVLNFYWANNERVIFTKGKKVSYSERFASYGQIFSGNIDGSNALIVYGVQAKGRVRRNKGPESAIAFIENLLPQDPEHIIIRSIPWYNDLDAQAKYYKLNVYSGKRELITKTTFGNMNVVFDKEGFPVFAKGRDRSGEIRAFWYVENDWKELGASDPLNNYVALGVDNNNKNLYLLSDGKGKPKGLYQYHFDNKSITRIYQHELVDVNKVYWDPDTNQPVSINIMPGKFEYVYLEKNHWMASLHAELIKAFAPSIVSFVSISENKNEVIVLVESDKNPGEFYLFDRSKNSAEHLLSKKPWIDPELMAPRTPIQFKARDGETIYGYLTEPLNAKNPVPLVTYVHGGPFGIQDSWLYDTTAQMLANNGFAVLQVNYRGSGGYGLDYETVAYKKLSTLIQYDIIDGTKWALEQPKIISDKACIMGWSFGGYSALMSPLIEQKLFSCSIAAAGVYDSVSQQEDADYAQLGSASTKAAEIYGDDKESLKKESPLTYIDQLKIPVFIVHGGRDKRVSPEQAHMLRAALDKRKLPYEWMFKPSEAHGFVNEQNRQEFYLRSLEFLNKHLK